VILDKFRLDNQVAVVTGAGRSLGLGMAAALAEAGADIVTVQRNPESPVLAERVAQAGRRLHVCPIDVTADQAAETALEQTLAAFGRVDILVNNAGAQHRVPAADFPRADWDRILAVNLQAVFDFCQVFGRVMINQRRGKIINIASVIAFQGGIKIPAYAAAKHAVVGLTRSFSNEWAAQGVNVNAIAPGYMDTDMSVALINDPERNRSVMERIPAGRWGVPEDLAGPVVFLASAASDYVHGEVLVVDGGWLAR